MKTCTKCSVEKNEIEFSKHKYQKDGLRSWCKACCSIYSKSRGRNRNRSLLSKHNITEKQYLDLLDKQGGKCAACGSIDARSRWGVFSVDHDHKCCASPKSCGLCIRGLLCHPCNSALGNVSDDITTLKNLICYLESSPKIPSVEEKYLFLRKVTEGKRQETRRKQSLSHMGKVLSESHRINLAKANKGKNLGYKHSEESRKKMSDAKKGHIPWNKGIKTTLNDPS